MHGIFTIGLKILGFQVCDVFRIDAVLHSRYKAIKPYLKSSKWKFRRDENFKTVYAEVIKDYLRQGHAEQVQREQQ
jgi:hypothetical protein